MGPVFNVALLTSLLLLCIVTCSNSESGLLPGGRCIAETPAEPKYFYYGDEAISVGIFTTDRLTHRISSTVLQIVAEEVLGYHNISLVYLDDPKGGFDPDTQFKYISSCTDFRFGWFLPERFARSTPPIKDHWRALTSESVAALFAPSDADRKFIEERMRGRNGSFICQESFCSETGMYESSRCRQQGKRSECALLLTDFPVHSSLFSTSLIVSQIEQLGLLVNVAFVGDRLLETVAYLDGTSEAVASGERSYLVFHYSPSRLTNTFNLTTVKFEPCDQRWGEPSMGAAAGMGGQAGLFYGDEDAANGDGQNGTLAATVTGSTCFYNLNRFAKVIWPHLREGAQALYATIKKMEFTFSQYEELLDLYGELSSANSVSDGLGDGAGDSLLIRETACTWLKRRSIMRNGQEMFNYQRWYMTRNAKQKLRIGGIFPIMGEKFSAPELLPVALLAKQHVNANDTILSNYELDLHISDGQCTASVVMKRFIEIITNRDYKSFVGILGPACTDTVEPIAGVSKHFRTVVVTYSAEGSIAADDGSESQYPYFFRTIAENKQYKYVYLEVLKKFKWSKVASLALDGHKYSEYISHLQDVLQTHGINFIMNRKFPMESPNMSMYLRDLKRRGARIIIGDFFERAARVIMCEAYKQDMTQKHGYVWFLPGWYRPNWYDVDILRDKNKEDEFMPNCTTSQMIEAIDGHLSLIHSTFANDDDLMQTGKTVKDWKDTVRQQLDSKGFAQIPVNKYSGYVYDAVWLYAQALDRLIKQNKSYIQDIHSERSVNEFVKIIGESDFHGVTGRINFANGHSRLSNIKIIQWYDNETHEIGIYEPDYNAAPISDAAIFPTKDPAAVADILAGQGRLLEWNKHNIRWKTPDGVRPNDHSKDCSILSDLATALNIECEHAIIFAFVLGFGLLLCCVLCVCFVFKRRYELKMRQTEERMRALGLLPPTSFLTLDEWEIPRDRVVINRKLGEGAFGTVFGGEAFFDEKGWSALERLWSVPSFKDIAMRTDRLDSNYIHKDGVLRVAVAVKTLKTGSSVEEKIDFLSEADMMKRFDHRNVVKLLGVCTRNEPVYTVMEFMLYGDLKTYLLARRHLVNERDREDQDEVSNRRLTSMALDVARGLSYLAELKYVHRDVACRNCLVNSSRMVKLADFGMTRPMYEHDYYRFNKKGMLPVRWMAPESLSDGLFTPMSDVWSYGVLLYEMITFGSFPFQGLSNNQVLEYVKSGNTLSIPAGIKSQLETLLKSCWNKTPTQRPTASELVELLSNNPRLITPCIDVPLASVQVERTDSLELIPAAINSSRKPSTGTAAVMSSQRLSKRPDYSGPYSPMNGIPNGGGASPATTQYMFGLREPLLGNGGGGGNSDGSSVSGRQQALTPNGNATTSSYVPPGYIVLDHRSTAAKTMMDNSDYAANSSVSSV